MGRRYSRRDSFGSAVVDCMKIANRLSPTGAIIVGLLGYALFFWLLPCWFASLAHDANAASEGMYAVVTQQFLNATILRRFIIPSEIAGIAILLISLAIAGWKICFTTPLAKGYEQESSLLARIVARWFD